MDRNNTKLYKTLEIEKNASQTTIKKAYRRLAAKYHPDRNKEPDAEEKFKEITNAYEILSDPNKRVKYDQFGEEGMNDPFAGGGFDPFGMFNMGRQQQKVTQHIHKLTLEEYFTKNSVNINVARKTNCNECDATGFTDKTYHKCKVCNGSGISVRIISHGHFIQQSQSVCPSCNGQKFDVTEINGRCPSCNGKGTIETIETIEANIPSNILGNPMTLLPEKGEFVGGRQLDLAVVFKLKMPKNFGYTSDRKLIYTMSINYIETMCGFKRVIEHPSGKKILIVSDKGNVINPDIIYTLDNLGFSNDVMYLTFTINYIDKIDIPRKTKELLNFENLEEYMGERFCPNYTENDIDPENVFNLSTIDKINNNPRAKKQEEPSENEADSDDDESQEMPGGCQTQ